MDKLQVFLILVLGLTCYGHGQISGSQLERTVRPGDNVTIYCDYEVPSAVSAVWFRNCSHENQPPLVLNTNSILKYGLDNNLQRTFPHYELLPNRSSQSFDLMILNITESDEGVYYCGTEEQRVSTSDYKYGKVTTRIILNSSEPQCHQQHQPVQDCGQCRMLLFSLCPVSALLSSLVCSLVVCLICRKTAKDSQADHQEADTGGHSDLNKVGRAVEYTLMKRAEFCRTSEMTDVNPQAEDVCYAALEIHQPSQRPSKKKIERSRFCTYSAIKTTEM